MNWSNKWENDDYSIIDTPKSFGQMMKEFNEKSDKSISIINETNQPQVIIGLDQGSSTGDKTVLHDGKGNIIGESITLAIPEGWNEKIVKAIQIGDLAVITSDDEEHCIAHVPTQTWFDNAIPEGSYTFEQYCLWAWKVQQEYHMLWEHLRGFNNLNYTTIGKGALEQIKCYCLSVPVV